MSRREALRALRALVLGETWTLSLAVAATVLAATVLRLPPVQRVGGARRAGPWCSRSWWASVTVSLPRAPARDRGRRG